MNVSELMNALKELPSDARVVMDTDGALTAQVHAVELRHLEIADFDQVYLVNNLKQFRKRW